MMMVLLVLHVLICLALVGLVLLGVFGAALLYGDGVITPAISVLSAVEGLKVAAPALEASRSVDLIAAARTQLQLQPHVRLAEQRRPLRAQVAGHGRRPLRRLRNGTLPRVKRCGRRVVGAAGPRGPRAARRPPQAWKGSHR